jgi:hypothetical protein
MNILTSTVQRTITIFMKPEYVGVPRLETGCGVLVDHEMVRAGYMDRYQGVGNFQIRAKSSSNTSIVDRHACEKTGEL